MYNSIGVNSEWGEGYVILPETENREQYIRRCYNTNTIILFTEMQGIFQNVQVPKKLFELIEFPEKPKINGTRVLWMREPMYHHVYIMQVLSNDPYASSDPGHTIGTTEGKNGATTSYSAKKGAIITTIQHVSRAIYHLVVRSPNKTALHKTEVSGSIESEAEHILMKAREGLQLICDDSSLELTDNEVKIVGERITLGQGDEALIKGTAFINFMEDFITELESTTVNTAFGQMRLINKDKIAKFKELLNDLASQLIYIS